MIQIVPCATHTHYCEQAYRLFCQHRDKPWQFDTFEKSTQQSCSLYAVENENLVGYILLSMVMDEAEIEDISVDQQYKRQGVASQLITKACLLASAQDIQQIFLEVAATNIAAISLYHKHQFVTLHTRKNYYRTSLNELVDAIVMRKSL